MKKKIEKNLSDSDMLKKLTEIETFETKVYKSELVKPKLVKEEGYEFFSLGKDMAAKLDKEIFRLRSELKKEGIDEIKWSFAPGQNKNEIIIKAVPKKSR